MIARDTIRIAGAFLTVAAISCGTALALDIQLPPETSAFRQDVGAEIANGQCLVCHSVEYVSTQPVMPRPFWKASVLKMQQKYGAQIQDTQVEPLVDYLVKNYGQSSNSVPSGAVAPSSTAVAGQNETVTKPVTQSSQSQANQIAMKYGCLGCHNAKIKIIGPAYRDIAAKYKGDPEAVAKINQQIHQGGSGKWGPVLMPPFPQVTADDTKVLTGWILSLK